MQRANKLRAEADAETEAYVIFSTAEDAVKGKVVTHVVDIK